MGVVRRFRSRKKLRANRTRMGIQYDVTSHWGLLFKLLPRQGSILGPVSRELFIAMVTSIAAVLVDRFVTTLNISNYGHTLLAFSLGFLLVFRSNQSYSRYNAGRGAVGGMVRDLRNLARQAAFFAGRGKRKDAAAVRRICRRCKLFFQLTVLHLRKMKNLTFLRTDLQLLTKSEQRLLKEEGNANPHTIIGWLANDLAVLRERKIITQKEHIAIDENLQSLTGSLLAVKKVQEMVLPFPYAQLLMTFLIIFVNTLPFVIIQIFGGATPLITVTVAYALFGINEVGIQLEDPFGTDPNDLAMPNYMAATSNDVEHYFSQAVLHQFLPALKGGLDATLAVGLEEEMTDLPSSVGSSIDSAEILRKQKFHTESVSGSASSSISSGSDYASASASASSSSS